MSFDFLFDFFSSSSLSELEEEDDNDDDDDRRELTADSLVSTLSVRDLFTCPLTLDSDVPTTDEEFLVKISFLILFVFITSFSPVDGDVITSLGLATGSCSTSVCTHFEHMTIF